MIESKQKKKQLTLQEAMHLFIGFKPELIEAMFTPRPARRPATFDSKWKRKAFFEAIDRNEPIADVAEAFGITLEQAKNLKNNRKNRIGGTLGRKYHIFEGRLLNGEPLLDALEYAYGQRCRRIFEAFKGGNGPAVAERFGVAFNTVYAIVEKCQFAIDKFHCTHGDITKDKAA